MHLFRSTWNIVVQYLYLPQDKWHRLLVYPSKMPLTLHLCLGFRRIECNLQKKTLDLYVRAKVLKDCLSWQAWFCHSFCSLYRTLCLLQLKIGTGRNIGKVKSRYSYHHVWAICYSWIICINIFRRYTMYVFVVASIRRWMIPWRIKSSS